MSFWVAFSYLKIYGIMGTDKTFDRWVLICFLQELINSFSKFETNSEKVWLVMDHANIHRNSDVEALLKCNKIKAFTISSYSAWLNPWEKLIALIKKKVSLEKRRMKVKQ